MFHDNIQDDAELLVNAKLLPQLSDGGYVEVWKYNKHTRDPPREHRVVLQVCCSQPIPKGLQQCSSYRWSRDRGPFVVCPMWIP